MINDDDLLVYPEREVLPCPFCGQHPTDPHEVIAACPDAMRALQAELNQTNAKLRHERDDKKDALDWANKQCLIVVGELKARIAELESELSAIKAQAGDSAELAQVNRELKNSLYEWKKKAIDEHGRADELANILFAENLPALLSLNSNLRVRISRLEQAIKDAPHAEDCPIVFYSVKPKEYGDDPLECDCWKSEALPDE